MTLHLVDAVDETRAIWRALSDRGELLFRVSRFNLVLSTDRSSDGRRIGCPSFWEVKRDGERFAVDIDVWLGDRWANVLDKYRRTGPTRLFDEVGRKECEQEALALAFAVCSSRPMLRPSGPQSGDAPTG